MKVKRYSLEVAKIVDDNFLSEEDRNDEIWGTVVSHESKENVFNDVGKKRETLPLAEEKIECLAISSKAKQSVYGELVLEYEQSVFQTIECLLRTVRIGEIYFNVNLLKYDFNCDTDVMPAGVFEVIDINKASENLVKAL